MEIRLGRSGYHQHSCDRQFGSSSLSDLVACVCVFVYSRDSTHQRAHVRELKVILMLVLGRHECVRGKFYININKLVFSKSDYDYNERVFVFYMFYLIKY